MALAESQLAIAPLLVPLVTAVAVLVLGFSRRLQVGVSVAGAVGYVAAVALLFDRVASAGTLVYVVSDWPAPFGIALVADPLATFMLGLAAAVALAAVVFSVRNVDPFGQGLSYHALLHFMLVGVTGSFLTGDLFNLFVWFEVMLMASYVLVVFYSGAEHTRAALQYVVLNLIGSAVMLLAIGGLYATTGTLNMADMARRLANAGTSGAAIADPAPVLGLSALLFAVFALKAGIVPFHFWVPAAYRAAPAPVAAVLAGVVKKVGVYAIVRLYFTVFAAATFPTGVPWLAGESALAFYGPVVLVLAAASILLGGIAAVAQDDVDGLLAYSSIGQVGFIVLPLAVAASVASPEVRRVAVAATLIYTVNHGVAKALLFLASGTIFESVGSVRFSDLGGLTERAPVLSACFLVGGLSLVGVPPLVGFLGKLYVFDALARGRATLALAVALVGAILTIAYVTRAWNRGFWGPPLAGEVEVGRGEVAILAALAVVVLALGIGAEPLVRAAEAASGAALDRGAYVDAVLGGGAA